MSDKKAGLHYLPIGPFKSDHQPKKSVENKKFQPQPLNLAELCDSPVDFFYNRAPKQPTNTNSKTNGHVRKLPCIPYVYNAADWQDSPLTSVKSKTTTRIGSEARWRNRNNGATAARVPLHNRTSCNGLSTKSSLTFKAKTKVEQAAKGARKELFTSKQSMRLQQIFSQISTAKRNVATACLDITEPLIDVSAAEAALFQKPSEQFGKNRFNREKKFNKATAMSSILFKVPVTKKPILPTYKTRFNKSLHGSNRDSSSSVMSLSKSMKEFVENEKQCFTESVFTELPSNAQMNQSKSLKKIQMILGNEQRCFEKLQEKYKNVCSSMNEFYKQHEEFQELYIGNRILIDQIIKNSSDSNQTEEVLHPSSEGASADSDRSPLLPVLDNNSMEGGKNSTRKIVTFNLKIKCADSENVCLEDQVVQKSLDSYNMLRTNFNTVLGTPKNAKYSLRAPKSGQKSGKDLISDKIQRQLLMLNDTPRKKMFF